MNVAFLFNADDPSLSGCYGQPVMELILGTQVLQSTNRHLRVSLGDMLTHRFDSSGASRYTALIELSHRVYKPKLLDQLIYTRLEETYEKAIVFCWLFQNMTVPVAEELHKKLVPSSVYLGSMDVDFSEPLHLALFRNLLCEKYRLYGKQCSVFYTSINEDPDVFVSECFERHAYIVAYEDIGVRRTIFDDYDSLEHFKRVEDFKRVFAEFNSLDADRVSDLALNLEELHPKLFDAFASAARTLERAETEEDYAQVALSGRRLLERVADYLFPPREGEWRSRKVGPANYRNRLWAYIDQTITEYGDKEGNSLMRIGKETDRLVELFNAGLHTDPTRQDVETAFSDLVIWASQVIQLSPEAVRRPYLARTRIDQSYD